MPLLYWYLYTKQPFVSTEFHKDGEGAMEFMNRNSDLYTRMSEVLAVILPSVSRAYQKYPILAELTQIASTFMGCVINIRTIETPVKTEPHHNVKESVFSISYLCLFGNYLQGSIILWELEMFIELTARDLLFNADFLIHHSNEFASDKHYSIEAFTQQNVFDYWKRKYRFKDKKKVIVKVPRKRNRNPKVPLKLFRKKEI